MLTLIAAISQNRCIGKDGKLPWHIPEDLRYFKATTMGHPVIMGRKTWESIPEKFKPLEGRKNIIVTRQRDYPVPEGVEKVESIEAALKLVDGKEAFVIGGAEIYQQSITFADRLNITKVNEVVDGDAFFPDINSNTWSENSCERHPSFTRLIYERKS